MGRFRLLYRSTPVYSSISDLSCTHVQACIKNAHTHTTSSIIFLFLCLSLHFHSYAHSISPLQFPSVQMKYIWHPENAPQQWGTIYLTNISHGSCNIYIGNVAVGDVNNAYHEQVEHPSKVRQHLPTFWQRRCSANPETHLHVTQRSWLTWSHLACLSN